MPNSGDMIERVARAIYDVHPMTYRKRVISWFGATPARRERCKRQADAALAAFSSLPQEDDADAAWLRALTDLTIDEDDLFDDDDKSRLHRIADRLLQLSRD